jgi:hypothetical protein
MAVFGGALGGGSVDRKRGGIVVAKKELEEVRSMA